MAGTEQLGLMFQAPARKVYAVRELVTAVRTQVERSFTDVYLEGEISNYRPAESGHLYFTLKDASAQLRTGATAALSSGERAASHRTRAGDDLRRTR